MKRILFLLVLISAFSVSSYATHNIAGTINYKHISGLTYEITVTTYTNDLAGAADRCELIVDFGDGTNQTVSRNNGPACTPCYHCGEVIGGNFKLNIYKTTHTFPTPNTYIISMLDPNRNQGIINIPNSVQVPFYIETELVILSAAFVNNSPVLAIAPVVNAQLGTTFRQNISAIDLDGDILSYELVNAKGTNGQDIPGYHLPDSVYIDIVNGELIWLNTPQVGEYVFTIKISECRDNNHIGYVLVDISIIVTPSQSNSQFTGLSSWPTDYFGRYSVTIGPNDSIELDLTYQDLYTYSTIDLEAYSEAFFTGNSTSFSTINSSLTSITKQFKWKPNSSNLRCAPYIVTFRGSSTISMTKTSNDVTLMVFVRDQTTINCGSVCGSILSVNNNLKQENVSVSISPNPISDQAIIRIKSTDRGMNFTFSLYNILGEKVRVITGLGSNSFVFSKQDLPSGIYLYTINGGLETLGSGKLVIVE